MAASAARPENAPPVKTVPVASTAQRIRENAASADNNLLSLSVKALTFFHQKCQIFILNMS